MANCPNFVNVAHCPAHDPQRAFPYRQTVANWPTDGARRNDKVMHAWFKDGDTDVMLSDGLCSGKPSFAGFSLSVTDRFGVG
jgi:uncharacterized glyoxalase superfamily protein PhnB